MQTIKTIKKKFHRLSEKNKIVAINIIGAFLIKGLSLFVSLFTTPAYIAFFDNEVVLGVWFTILSVISWILNFDLGIGNGLRNHLTKAITENDLMEARKLISSAYAVIGIVCVSIIAIALFSFDYVNWNSFFNIEYGIVSEKTMRLTVKIVFIGIVLQIFFKIISSVLYALQKSSVNNAISLVTSFLILLVLMIAQPADNDYNLVFMGIVYDASVILPYIAATVLVFSNKEYKSISPGLFLVRRKHATKVLSLGGYFFIIQLLYMLIMSTNEYLISLFTNSSDVVEYRLYFQIFTLGSTVCALALTPVWSAITKAITEKDLEWITKLYRTMIGGAFIGCLLEFIIVPLLQPIFDCWLGDATIRVNYLYALSFALLGSLMLFNAVFSNVANGLGKLRTQLIVFLIGAIFKVPLSFLLIKITHSWIGIVIATNIDILAYCIVQPIVLSRLINHKRIGLQ